MDRQSKLQRVVDLFAGFANSATTSFLVSQKPELSFVIPYIATTLQVMLIDIGYDFVNKTLSKREIEKFSISFITAANKIKARQDIGDNLRNDSFFQDKTDDYSDAYKLLEAVFIESRNEFENKKLIYLGNLTANLLYTDRHDYNRCLYFITLTENLNYRQLCYLKLLKNKSIYNLERKIVIGKDSYKVLPIDHRYELHQMVTTCILKGPREFKPNSSFPLENYNTDWVGDELYELMNLDEIPEADIEIINK